MPTVLDTEWETFERHREELVGRSEGKYVLIHGDQILGVFDSQRDAIAQGYERLGNVPFLVKQILRFDVPQNFVTNLLGI
ncbi:MAG: hypothetical protein HY234_04310 [Acidobacteria bacterium]|nr:hypothetical protein [Acidobacteriota bacterium]MBI3662259.1 hypothetical protein [Acidobacteriota bacterium]